MTNPGSSAPRDLARELLARHVTDTAQPSDAAAALQRVCTRASENLRRAVGNDGHNALLARALRRTEGEHPALTDIRRLDDAGIYLDGVVTSAAARGMPAVAAALEALLTALIDILSSLIGADMVLNLLDSDGPPSPTPSGTPTR